MTIETLDPKFCGDFSSAQQVDFAIKENDFTAGYTQRDQDGINNVRDTWQVSFPQLSFTDMEELWTFLQDKKGYVSFMWTPPREVGARRWTCTKLSRSADSSNAWNVQAVFEQQFTHFAGEVVSGSIPGVAAIGHAGTCTVTESFAPGTVGVPGIEAVGTAGAVFPSRAFGYGEPFSWNEITSYQTAVIPGDGYMYVWYSRSYIAKIQLDIFEIVDVLDLNAQTSGGPGHIFGSLNNFAMCSDGTYLYFAIDAGKLTRVLLSDFRTTSTIVLTSVNVNYQNIACMAAYSGNLYLFLNDTQTKCIKVDLSHFTTGGVSALDWATLSTTGQPIKNVIRGGIVIADQYAFVAFSDSDIIMRIDLSSFTVGTIVLLNVSSFPDSRFWGGRGAYDGTYIYFANVLGGYVIRINKSNTSFETLQLPNLPVGPFPTNTFAACGLVLEGTNLWGATTSRYGGANAAVKIDLTSSATFANLTVTYFDIENMNLGDSATGNRSFINYPTYGYLDQGYNDIASDGTWLYAIPNSGNHGLTIGAIQRMMLNQTHTNFGKPSQLAPTPPSFFEQEWTGGDNSGTEPVDTVTITNSSFTRDAIVNVGGITYVLMMAMKFKTAGGAVTSVVLGGNVCTKVVDVTKDNMYVGIWMLQEPAITGRFDLVVNMSAGCEYYDIQAEVYEGYHDNPVIYTNTYTGNGTSVAMPFSVPSAGQGFASVAVNEAFASIGQGAISGGSWYAANWDTWGPSSPYTDSISTGQLFDDLTPNSPAESGTLTYDWSADAIGAQDYCACIAIISRDNPPSAEASTLLPSVFAFGGAGYMS